MTITDFENVLKFLKENNYNSDEIDKIRRDHYKRLDFKLLIDDIMDQTLATKVKLKFIRKLTPCVSDSDYYQHPFKQAKVMIDFSLSKKQLISQISKIKDAADNGEIFLVDIANQNPDIEIENELNNDAISFSKSIQKNFGDALYAFDCTILKYKDRDIANDIYDFRKNDTTISRNTINGYFKKINILIENDDILSILKI